jgi:hypothetical protein
VIVDASTALPFPDAELFCIAGLKQPESVLLIRRGGGLLLTCDGIQSYGDYTNNNLPARLVMPFIGFKKTTIIGPFWLKLGQLVRSGAHAAVEAAVEKTFA